MGVVEKKVLKAISGTVVEDVLRRYNVI